MCGLVVFFGDLLAFCCQSLFKCPAQRGVPNGAAICWQKGEEDFFELFDHLFFPCVFCDVVTLVIGRFLLFMATLLCMAHKFASA